MYHSNFDRYYSKPDYEEMRRNTLRWIERTGKTPYTVKQETLERLRASIDEQDYPLGDREQYKKDLQRIETLSDDEYFAEWLEERIAARGRLTR